MHGVHAHMRAHMACTHTHARTRTCRFQALTRRGLAYESLEKYEEAFADLERVHLNPEP